MVLPPKNGLSLCAGGGGLDMGLELAEPGFATSCYVEIEKYPRDCLIAAQRAGYMRSAPIWDDLKTFNARPWRGLCDTLLAGYPCQPFSQAGQRKGADDPRHLWPDIKRIVGELRPTWCFFENVSGHLSLGLETVVNDLRRMGFSVAVGVFSAEETGAAHERQRVFIVAYSDSNEPSTDRREPDTGTNRRHDACGGCGTDVGQRAGADIKGRERVSSTGRHVADTSQSGPQGGERPGTPCQRHGQAASGSVTQLRRPLLQPPGPNDTDAWSAILGLSPDLAPAVSLRDVKRTADNLAQMVAQGSMAESEAESVVRGMADAMASRTRALRLLGNGVCPLEAAYAFQSLSAAHGLGRVDMGAPE